MFSVDLDLHLVRVEIITMLIYSYSDTYILNTNTVWKHFQRFFAFRFTYTAWLRAGVRKLQARGWLRELGLYPTFVEITRGMAWRSDMRHPQSPSHHHATLPACFSFTQEGSAFQSSLLGFCQRSCQVSLRQNPLTSPVCWRSLFAVRCCVISDPGWTFFLWLLTEAEMVLPFYQTQQISLCLLSVDVG